MDGPRKLTIKLQGEVRVKWSNSEGVYSLSPNLVNRKPIWMQESGKNALWYDEAYHNWKIGLVSGIGGSSCHMKSNANTEGNPPHKVVPWKYFKNGDWTGSKDIILFCDSIDN